MGFEAVGQLADLETAELTAVEVGGQYIALAYVDGEVHAFDDVCTHRGCSLSEGELDEGEVICPCHAGSFDVKTGEVLEGPPPEPVAVYPVRVSDGVIEVDA